MSKQRTSTAPATPLSCRILRSPSHESVTSDLSFFPVSSLEALSGSGGGSKHRLITFKEHRGPSPNPDIRGVHMNKPADIPEVMWLEEGNDLILSCAQLSSVLGLQKSFSTSDITQLPSTKLNGSGGGAFSLSHAYADLHTSNVSYLRQTMSERALNLLQLGYMLDSSRLDHTSRSCSTWVAVGELASTSQLPSPHGGPVSANVNTSSSQQQLSAANANIQSQPTFTAVDLLLSVNKSVRRNYIRRRLLTTYRAIERLSQIAADPGPTELVVPATAVAGILSSAADNENVVAPSEPTSEREAATTTGEAGAYSVPAIEKPRSVAPAVICPQLKNKLTMNINNRNLTINDIEKERGRPLSKYDRNIMIFNWLHSLDETSTVEEYNNL